MHGLVTCADRQLRKQKDRVDHEKRFNDVMERHRQRIYLLEAERREVLEQPASELDEWETRRRKAAVKVQAHWRGLVQRRKLREQGKQPEAELREKVGSNLRVPHLLLYLLVLAPRLNSAAGKEVPPLPAKMPS